MKPGKDSNHPRANMPPGAAVIDLVCGMTVNPDTASGFYEYQGEIYYFCSTHCLDKFRADPEQFLSKSREPKTPQSVEIRHDSKPRLAPVAQTYTCPMHPEVRQEKPGPCPKCGMALEPVAPRAAGEKMEYTCPMHPQIVRDKPGNCPICGMALEPRTITAGVEENPELKDMWRRFLVAAVLTAPLILIALGRSFPGLPIANALDGALGKWLEF